jgi:hypothetical protein
MKTRTLLTLLFVTAFLATATAQKAKHAEIGIQGGFASVWIINQNNYGLVEMDYDYQWGPGFSFQAGYNFTNNIGLFTEIGFARGGQKYDDIWNNNDEIRRNIDLSYLNVPLLFKYSYGESRARFRLLFGPQFSFLQKAEQEYTINGEPFSKMITDLDGNEFDAGAKDIKDRYSSTDVSIVLDLGADIFLLEEVMYLSIGARGYYGLTDINAEAYRLDNIDGNYDNSRNAGLMFNLGIHYIIGSK